MHTAVFRSFAIYVLVGVITILSPGCSREGRIARSLSRADAYFASDGYEKAEIEYKNVLQLDGKNAQAIGRLGVIYYEQGRTARAFGYLQKATDLKPEDLQFRLKLGQLYLAAGSANEAREAASFILEQKPDDADAPLLLAAAAVRPKDVIDSRDRLRMLPATAVDRAPVLVALGLLELRERKFKEADSLFERARSLDPKSNAAVFALATSYRLQNELVKAEEAYAAAAAMSPARSPNRLQHALFNLQTGHPDAAKRILEETSRNAPDFLPPLLLLADIAADAKNPKESIVLLEKILARDPDYPEALLRLARVRLDHGEKEKALVILDSAIKKFPQWADLHHQLALAHLAHGNVSNAVASLHQALRLAPDHAPAKLALAGIDIRRGNFDAAIAALKPVVQQQPKDLKSLLLLAGAQAKQGNLGEAIAIYRQLSAGSPRDPQMPTLAGALLLRQNKKAEAREELTKALALAPGYFPALEQLTIVDLSEKQFAAAEQRVNGQIAANPTAAHLHLLLAKIYFAQSKTNEGENALRKVIELRPDSSEAYLVLADLYIKTNQEGKAAADLRAAAAQNPKDPRPLVILGVILDREKNYQAARETYEKILAIDPKSAIALNNLAYLYSERFGELDKALEMAQKARTVSPNESVTIDTLGWILFRKRQYPQALALIEESAEKLPDNADVQFHLGMARYMMGQEASAKIALEQSLKLNPDVQGANEARQCLLLLNLDGSNPGASNRAIIEKALETRKDDPVALARLAAIYEQEKAVDKAVATYETLLGLHPGNVPAALNAIRLYRSRNETPKALELAKAMRKLAPADAGVAHALGRLAYEAKDFPRAFSLLQEASRDRISDPYILFDWAQSAYSIGQVSIAETAMRDALQANPRADIAAKARRFLDMLALAASPAQAAGSAGKIEEALKADSSDVSALVAKATAAEHNRNASDASRIYEKILTLYPDFAPAIKRLAILYLETPANAQKAIEFATKARAAFPSDAEVAKTLGILVFRQGNHRYAITLLQDSYRTRPDDGELLYYLGMAQNQIKDVPASRRSLQQALDLGLKGSLAAEAQRVLSVAAP